MNKKIGIIILSILVSTLTVFLVQAKPPQQTSIRSHSEIVSIGPEIGTSNTIFVRYEPEKPEVVTVWMFLGDDTEGFDEFQIEYVSYDDKIAWGGEFPLEYRRIYNKNLSHIIFSRIAIADSIEIGLYRIEEGGGDTDTIEVQWIVES